MITDNFCFYLQIRLIQTNQTGGQWYSDTSPFSIPCLRLLYTADFRDRFPIRIFENTILFLFFEKRTSLMAHLHVITTCYKTSPFL
jgi:hypothetical protein